MYKNNVILLPKVRRKYKKHSSIGFKNYKWWKKKHYQSVLYVTKKSRFIKKQEAKGLLSNLVLEHL